MDNKKEQEDNRYYIKFRGARLTKREAKIVGFSILFGWFGSFVAILVGTEKNSYIAWGIITFFALAGYAIGRMLFQGRQMKKRLPPI